MHRRLEVLHKATHDPDPAVRHAAVRSLSAVEQVMDIDRLLALAQNGKRQARLRAVYALGDMRSASGLEALSDLLRTGDDQEVRAAAASCLAQRGLEAVPHLRAGLDDAERSVAEEAMRALGQVGGDETVEWLIDAARRRQPLEDAAIEALRNLGDDRAADFLIEFVRNGTSEQQRAALQALAGLSAEAAEEALVEAAEAEDADLRRIAVEALGELGPPKTETPAPAGATAYA